MGTPERPLLKPWYRIAWADGTCLLEYGGSAVSLEGLAVARLLPALLPLLDGRRTVEEIEAALGAAVAPAVEQALAALAQAGVLTDGPPLRGADATTSSTALAELLADASPTGESPWRVAEALAASSVAIGGSGETADRLGGLLSDSGVGRIERLDVDDLRAGAATGELLVASPAPDELPSLQQVNETALERELPWLQVLPFDGHAAYVGPLFLPGATCCHRCVQLRRASTAGYRDALPALDRVTATHGVASPVASMLAGLAATIALRWLTGHDARLPGRLYVLALWPAPAISEHVAYRVPRCPACSQAETAASPSPWFEAPIAVT